MSGFRFSVASSGLGVYALRRVSAIRSVAAPSGVLFRSGLGTQGVKSIVGRVLVLVYRFRFVARWGSGVVSGIIEVGVSPGGAWILVGFVARWGLESLQVVIVISGIFRCVLAFRSSAASMGTLAFESMLTVVACT